MKVRVIVVAVLTAATVTACSSSGGSGNQTASPTGGPTGSPTGAGQTGASAKFCTQLSTAVHKTSGLQGAISNPQQLKSKLPPVISALKSAKADAPADVSKSIDDLLGTMQGAQRVINGGNPQALLRKMNTLMPKLEHDFSALGQYLAKHCHGAG